MLVELFKPGEMNADFWAAFKAMRDASSDYDDPFFDPEFARCVGAMRDDTYIAVAMDRGAQEPIGFWPLHVRPGGWARPIGGPFSDWHGPVVRAGEPVDPAVFLSAANLGGFTAFGMPGALSWGHLDERVGANMTDLSMGWDAYLAQQTKLFPKHFKKIRRMQRNLERDFSSIEYNMDDTSRDAFDWLISRKRRQYGLTGRHDVLGPDWARALMEQLRGHQSERLSTRLMTLRVDGEPIAAEFNLVSDNVVHGWITGFCPLHSYYSPGYLLQHDILRQMPGLGLTLYDAGVGLDYYKKYYATHQLPVDIGVIRAAPPPRFPRIFAEGWRITESAMPGPIGRVMGKVRRRTDQIVLAETTFGGRVSGFAKAFKR